MECVDLATFIGGEITTVLKVTVDNVILELCNWCDYFASPLLVLKKKKIKSNGVISVSFIPMHIPKKAVSVIIVRKKAVSC